MEVEAWVAATRWINRGREVIGENGDMGSGNAMPSSFGRSDELLVKEK